MFPVRELCRRYLKRSDKWMRTVSGFSPLCFAPRRPTQRQRTPLPHNLPVGSGGRGVSDPCPDKRFGGTYTREVPPASADAGRVPDSVGAVRRNLQPELSQVRTGYLRNPTSVEATCFLLFYLLRRATTAHYFHPRNCHQRSPPPDGAHPVLAPSQIGPTEPL